MVYPNLMRFGKPENLFFLPDSEQAAGQVARSHQGWFLLSLLVPFQKHQRKMNGSPHHLPEPWQCSETSQSLLDTKINNKYL